MKPSDIFKFLIGDRDAIQRIAGSWWALLVGAILVLIGGLSRNYDHLDLLHNPEWIIGPYIASAVTSLIVFAIVYLYLGLRKVADKQIRGMSYLSFLTIYWMTSPCALLYAIPVESFTDLITATKWNVGFLAMVSVWRVALMTRALNVLTGAPSFTCFTAILFPASAMMCVGSFFKALSLVGIMGGVKLPPHTEVLQSATLATSTISFWLAVAAISTIIVSAITRNRKTAIRPLPWRKVPPPRRSIITATIMITVCTLMTVPRQIKIQHNHRLETLIKNNNYQEAIDYASNLQEDDFSTIHYLPPNPYSQNQNRNEKYRRLISMLDGTEPEWLKKTWIEQYTESLLLLRWQMNDIDIEFVQSHPKVKAHLIKQTTPEQLKNLFKDPPHP